MTRCAIYARYSSDRQNERSVADQVALCTRYAETSGWEVVRLFSDAAISGQAMANRPGLLDALSAAERGDFDILLAEHEDRIARDLEHQVHVFKRLQAAGVEMWTLATGKVQLLHVAMLGYMAEEYIANLSAKTKRGVRSNAEKGLATGARLYGYRTEPGGHIEIVEAEAEIIRRICRMYADGATAREIAGTLNAEGVPGPKGGQWNASTISGCRQRGNGILNTELYVGVKVWGRDEVRKDRATGKRQHRYLPPDQWQRTPVPHLRIVDDETWAKVRARKQRASANPESARRRPGIFSGLLRCGVCGGSYTSYTQGKLVCSAFRERKTCHNSRMPQRAAVEAKVLEIMREDMLSPEAVASYIRAYHRAAQSRQKNAAADRRPLERRLAEIERALDRGADAILRGVANATIEARMGELEREKAQISEALAQVNEEPKTVAMHPRMAETYAEMVAALQATLADYGGGATNAERQLVEAVRALVARVVITPLTQQRGGPINIKVEGRLAEIFHERPENFGSARTVAGASYTANAPTVPRLFARRL